MRIIKRYLIDTSRVTRLKNKNKIDHVVKTDDEIKVNFV
jgi:hypothetical protein